jgi:peptidoglycan/xylan/chitin deacetylase (PgdA/CDA1 family)
MTSITVALTLDFDAESGLADAGNKGPTALSRGSYGATEGISRILKLFQQYQVPGTCFIPAYTVNKYPDQCKMLRDAGFEIGHHGCLHESPDTKTFEEERAIIECGLEALEKHLGVKPVGYRAPWLRQSLNTYKLLLEYGFEYDSSECGQDRPYFLNVDGKKLLEIPTKYELIDTPLFFNLACQGFPPAPVDPDVVEKIWQREFDGMYQANEDLYYIHIVHPFCIGHFHRLQMYERLIKYMKQHSNVVFSTMTQIANKFAK